MESSPLGNLSSSLSSDDAIISSLKYFSDEVKELYLPKQVPVINHIPEPFEFYRNYVAPNIPVLIKGGIKHWEALKKWNREYFCQKIGSNKFTVAVTPNGYADAIKKTNIDGLLQEIFVLPEERLMTMSEFYDKLEASSQVPGTKNRQGVFYMQKQNSNLVEEFPQLLPDIDSRLNWASESFQSNPAAINLWIGDQKAITSLHKDPFENIYCVVSGFKDFILLPPTDRPWLPYKMLPVGQYKETSPGLFEIKECVSGDWMFKSSSSDLQSDSSNLSFNAVPWIAIDPVHPNYDKYPLYHYASPIHVHVEEGDALYLPSLWFHHVKQSHMCIAVNFWYDMNLDIKYAYFQLLDKLAEYL